MIHANSALKYHFSFVENKFELRRENTDLAIAIERISNDEIKVIILNICDINSQIWYPDQKKKNPRQINEFQNLTNGFWKVNNVIKNKLDIK